MTRWWLSGLRAGGASTRHFGSGTPSPYRTVDKPQADPVKVDSGVIAARPGPRSGTMASLYRPGAGLLEALRRPRGAKSHRHPHARSIRGDRNRARLSRSRASGTRPDSTPSAQWGAGPWSTSTRSGSAGPRSPVRSGAGCGAEPAACTEADRDPGKLAGPDRLSGRREDQGSSPANAGEVAISRKAASAAGDEFTRQSIPTLVSSLSNQTTARTSGRSVSRCGERSDPGVLVTADLARAGLADQERLGR